MRTGLLDYVLDGSAASAPDGLLAAAGALLAGAPDGRAEVLRRTWLDTFDWRLYRAGLTLEQVRRRGATELTLTGRDGEVIAAQQLASRPGGHGAKARWPCLASELPPGPLAERVEPVAGVRALLPVARAVSRVTRQRALNDDGKTVARLALDAMSVSFPADGAVAPRLSVLPLRGYAGPAARLAQALAAAPGVAPSAQSGLEAALAAAGARPGAYTGKLSARLSAAMPASEALAVVLTELLDMVTANLDGTIRDIDIEYLHDLRVAVRRTRSVLKLAGDALPGGLAGAYAPEFKWLGDLTTPTRDLDVYLLGYPAMASGLVAGDPRDLRPLRENLLRRRRTARRKLTAGLRSDRFATLAGKWRAALAAPPGPRGKRESRAAARPAGQLAADRIGRAHRRVLAGGTAISAASPPQSLHDLRKRAKELRYLMELFGSLHDQAALWQAVRALKSLQDCLGEFQDCEVQLTELRLFAAQMLADAAAPAPTLLAMGEIAAGMALRQRAARSEFADRFRAFASPAGRAAIAELANPRGGSLAAADSRTAR